MKKLIVMIVAVFVVTEVAAHHFYSKFPITLKGYTCLLYTSPSPRD